MFLAVGTVGEATVTAHVLTTERLFTWTPHISSTSRSIQRRQNCLSIEHSVKGKGKGKGIAVCETSPHRYGKSLTNGITQCYLPPGRGDFPAFTPAEAGTRFSDPEGMQG